MNFPSYYIILFHSFIHSSYKPVHTLCCKTWHQFWSIIESCSQIFTWTHKVSHKKMSQVSCSNLPSSWSALDHPIPHPTIFELLYVSGIISWSRWFGFRLLESILCYWLSCLKKHYPPSKVVKNDAEIIYSLLLYWVFIRECLLRA